MDYLQADAALPDSTISRIRSVLFTTAVYTTAALLLRAVIVIQAHNRGARNPPEYDEDEGTTVIEVQDYILRDDNDDSAESGSTTAYSATFNELGGFVTADEYTYGGEDEYPHSFIASGSDASVTVSENTTITSPSISDTSIPQCATPIADPVNPEEAEDKEEEEEQGLYVQEEEWYEEEAIYGDEYPGYEEEDSSASGEGGGDNEDEQEHGPGGDASQDEEIEEEEGMYIEEEDCYEEEEIYGDEYPW
ncbi:hypothetical protein C0991_012333, partial [Blastosporella zonata]